MHTLFAGMILWLATFTGAVAVAAVETGTLEQSAPSAPSRIKLDLYGWTYGNSIDNWDGRRATATGLPGDPIQINNQLIFHTPAFGSMDFSIVGNFVVQPFMGLFLQGQNPAVGMQGTIFESGGFSYWARYHLAVPVMYESRAQGMLVGPEAVNSVGYRIPGSKFKLEAVIVPSVKFYNNGDASSFVYVSPRLYYLASESLWLVSIYETSWEGKRSAGPMGLYTTGQPNLGFGFRYTANNGKGLYVQPFINTYPFGASIASSHLGVIFGGPLL